MFINIFRYLSICLFVCVSLSSCESAVELNNPVDKSSSSDPYVHFTAEKAMVDGEEVVALTWSSGNVDYCIASGAWSGVKNLNGEDFLSDLAAYRRYSISCISAQGNVVSEQVDLTESAVIPTLEITSTSEKVKYGGSTTIDWSSSEVNSCVAAGDWAGDQILNGSLSLQNILQDKILTLTCSGDYGSISEFVLVLIDDSVTPELPELLFTTSSFQVSDDSSFTLGWSTKRADNCKASGDWLGDKALSGSELISSIDSNSRFILSCEGAGGTITRSLDVMLNGLAPVAPQLNLIASPAAISPNQSTTLQWSSSNVDSCEASGQWSGSKPVLGSEETSKLQEDSVFTLSCSGAGGSVSVSKTVKVTNPVLTFTTSLAQVSVNTPFTLNWSSNSFTACQASGAWSGDKGLAGSEVIDSIDVNSHFILKCDGPTGSITRVVDVLIKEEIQPPPQLSLSASPSTVSLNESTSLQWSSTNADSCEASGDWSGSKSTSGSQLILNIQQDSIFNLSCSGPGGSVTISQAVKVADPVLSFNSTSTQVGLNTPFTLNWSAVNASSCAASGDWSGVKGISGSETITSIDEDSHFVMQCAGPAGSITQTVDVSVLAIPQVSLSADPTTVDLNGSTTLQWSSINADSCEASGQWSGTKLLSGNEAISNLQQDSEFILLCTGPGGAVTASTVVVVTDPVPDELPELSFTASATQVAMNSEFVLDWSSSNATSCVASGDWEGEKDLSGSETISSIDADSHFVMQCQGPAGSITRSIDVTVLPAPLASLSATPTAVTTNESTTLEWSTSNAESCEASGQWLGTKPVSGTEVISNLQQDSEFTLLCTGPGGSVTTSATVTVTEPVTSPLELSFTASATQVPLNTAFTLNWSSANASNCEADGDWSGDKGISGSETISSIDADSHFVMQCQGPASSITRTVDVSVLVTPQVSLTADPITVPLNGSTTLQWSSSNADTCEASGQWSGTKSLSGTEVISNIQQNSEFTLLCTGPGGVDTASVTVTIDDPELSFTTTSTQVPVDTAFTLSWVADNAISCEASGDWAGDKGISGSETITSIDADSHFVMQCHGPASSITRTIDVAVLEAPQLSLSANPSTVIINESTTLEWSSSNADSCEASGQWSGTKPVSGTELISNLQQDSEFTMVCTGPGGSVTITLTVQVAVEKNKPNITVSRYLTWDRPTKNMDNSTLTDLAGYRIFYGNNSGDYTNTITVEDADAEIYLIEGLTAGEWFFAMTAFTSQHIESNLSVEYKVTIEESP